MKIFPESSFFKEQRAPGLPTPVEIRAINKELGGSYSTDFHRPPPVKLPSLGLVVKYGGDITILEAQTQLMAYEKLKGQVPIPEVFGWTEDERQVFIYMSLIEGETLEERWSDMNEEERLSVCEELKHMAKAWRALELPEREPYIGNVNKQPLNDMMFASHPEFGGPFHGANAVGQFHDACGIGISGEVPIVFTHNDFVAPNILLSPGPNPKVAAVIDWAYSGWYPSYWEYCKARRVDLSVKHLDRDTQEEWRMKYLPIILDPVDDETYYHPWLYFFLSKGI